MTRLLLLYLISVLVITCSTSAQSNNNNNNNTEEETSSTIEDEELSEIDPNQAYCFKFTWLGPEYDNTTYVNTTCTELLDQKRAKNVPCKMPLVITHDGTPPELDYLWTRHKLSVACRRTKGQVCAKYSYKFNGQYENITYMCTKVYTEDEGAEESGCFKQKLDGRDVELCLCQSVLGDYKPCNSAKQLTFFACFWLILYYIFKYVF